MGNAPHRPSEARAEELRASLEADCAAAAAAISAADVLLVCTGAGFSADSGLAVYRDIAKVEAYAARKLAYHDICVPRWLGDEPDLFWGFWGRCFNDYRETAPHAGYDVIRKWRDDRFSETDVARRIRQALLAERADDVDESPRHERVVEPYHVLEDDAAGAFFVFTSNVDAHSFDVFAAHEVRECHGNTELYQCAEPCSRRLWRAPLGFKFEVDPTTILAPDVDALPPTEANDGDRAAANGDADDGSARIGRTYGAARHAKTLLKHMPAPTDSTAEIAARHVASLTLLQDPDVRSRSFSRNHPKCDACGGAARPAILMFGDSQWVDSAAQDGRYKAWQRAVRAEAREFSERALRLAILEVGAGDNVTTVRVESENVFRRAENVETTVIRVNPELPLNDADVDKLAAGGVVVLPVLSRGLAAVHMIDAAVDRIRRGDGATPPPPPPLEPPAADEAGPPEALPADEAVPAAAAG
ncbi:hypothetical protein M885DRAFT_512932 [Pelagophyceae sp. CCMP2097]|nr:hypothetical protein M885DRAFT_512932 [Pelagophyceae sp. CCMP2097]